MAKKPYDRERYWRALGKFVDAFASVETGMHILLWERARIDYQVSQALHSGVRIQEAMSLIRRVCELYPPKPETAADQEYIFAQIKVITDLRNDILHYGSRPQGEDTFIVDNWITALGESRYRSTTISVAALLGLTHDLKKIQAHLIERHLWREPGLMSSLSARERALLTASWRYKPPEQRQRRQKTRATAPKR